MTNRIHARLTMRVLAKKGEDEYEVTMLAGDGEYNGVWFPASEVGKPEVAESFVGQPLNLDHSWLVEDEVGYIKSARSEEGNLRGTITLNPATAKYGVAKAYIENRLAAGKAPEVSVGVYLSLVHDDDEDAEHEYIATELEGDHLALVTRGACGPGDGCGIGLSKSDSCPCGRHAPELNLKENPMKTDKTELEMDPKDAPEMDAPEMDAIPDEPEKTADADAPEMDPEDSEAEMADEPEDEPCPCGMADALADARKDAEEMRALARELLTPQAEALGIKVAKDECVKTLRARIADVESALAKLGKTREPARLTRKTSPGRGKAALSEDEDEAARLVAIGRGERRA